MGSKGSASGPIGPTQFNPETTRVSTKHNPVYKIKLSLTGKFLKLVIKFEMAFEWKPRSPQINLKKYFWSRATTITIAVRNIKVKTKIPRIGHVWLILSFSEGLVLKPWRALFSYQLFYVTGLYSECSIHQEWRERRTPALLQEMTP